MNSISIIISPIRAICELETTYFMDSSGKFPMKVVVDIVVCFHWSPSTTMKVYYNLLVSQ